MTQERPPVADGSTRPGIAEAVWQVVVVVGSFALAGVIAGIVWEWVWTPPVAVANQHTLQPTLESAGHDFSGAAWYVVVALVAGLVTAVAVGLAFGRREILTLVAVLVASTLAAWVMLKVGQSLGPPDAEAAAAKAADQTPIPIDLDVAGRSPFFAFPAGALVGLIVAFFGSSRRRPL